MSKVALEAKRKIIDEIKSKITDSKSIVFVNYQGINVEQDTKLRKNFREREVDYKIYKNRLIKIALDELGIAGYDATHLEGTTSVAFGRDEVSAASVLFEAKKDVKCLEAKFGIVLGSVVDSAKIEELSKIPSREVLISKLLFMLNYPASSLARVINEIAKKGA